MLTILLAGCDLLFDRDGRLDWTATAGPGFTLATAERDRTHVPQLLAWSADGRAAVEAFFGKWFRDDFTVRVFPDRASLVAYWHGVWRTSDLDVRCGSVAAARTREITFLSPSAWATDACGLDASSDEPAFILTHELVHVLHHQWSPRLGAISSEAPWFVEGLAVFASGQLRRDYAARVRAAVVLGEAPQSLSELWSGPLRYGMAGSVVAYLDAQLGRARLGELLAAASQQEVFAAVGRNAGELLAEWRTWILSAP
jgi:hypothetical protein